MSAPLILAGTLRVPLAHIEAARPHLEAMARASNAEPGCRAYSFAFDVLEPGMLRIFEVFESPEARSFHSNSPHMADWRAACAKFGIGDRDMTRYDVSRTEKI